MPQRICAIAVVLAFALHLAARPDPEVQGIKLSEWLGMFKTGKAMERNFALQAIAKLPVTPIEAVPTLLDSFNSDERELIVYLLDKCDAEAVPALVAALKEGKDEAKAVAAEVLGRMGAKAKPAIPELLALAKDGPEAIRPIAIRALGNLRVRDAMPIFMSMAKGGSSQSAAVGALILLDAPVGELTPLLKQMMRDKDDAVRIEAIRLCSVLGPEGKELVPDLLKLLDSGDAVSAAYSLGIIGTIAQEALPALRSVMADPKQAYVIDGMAGAIWKIQGDPKCADALRSVKYDGGVLSASQIQVAEMLWLIAREPKAIDVFRDALRKGKQADMLSALQALIRIGPPARDAVPELVELLKSKDEYLPYLAAAALGRIGTAAAAAAPDMKAAIKAMKPDDRSLASLDLWRIERNADALGTAAEGLKSDKTELRYQVANGLGFLGADAKSVLPALREALKHPDGDTRQVAALAVRRITNTDESLPVIIDCLGDKDPGVRQLAVLSLGYDFGNTAPIPALIKLLRDPDALTRSRAAEALGRIGVRSKEAVPALVAGLTDEEEFVVSGSVEALGLIGADSKDALPAIKGFLKHPDGYIRAHAVLAVWNIEKNKENLAAAREGLLNRNRKARVVFAEACGAMGEPGPAVETLMAVLREFEADSNTHYMAVRSLGRLGPAAKAAFPQVARLLDDLDPDLARTAREALRSIDPEAAKKLP